MDIRRIMGSRSHLLKTVMAARVGVNKELFANPMASQVADGKMEKKRIMFQELRSLNGPERIAYAINKMLRIEKKGRDSVTRSDMINWAVRMATVGEPETARKMYDLSRELGNSCPSDDGEVYLSLPFLSELEEKVGVAEILNKKPAYISQADLFSWAKYLDNEGKHLHALEIFEWLEERKKKSFTRSQLAEYLKLIIKIKGYQAAEAYIRKLYPDKNKKVEDWVPRKRYFSRFSFVCPRLT